MADEIYRCWHGSPTNCSNCASEHDEILALAEREKERLLDVLKHHAKRVCDELEAIDTEVCPQAGETSLGAVRRVVYAKMQAERERDACLTLLRERDQSRSRPFSVERYEEALAIVRPLLEEVKRG